MTLDSFLDSLTLHTSGEVHDILVAGIFMVIPFWLIMKSLASTEFKFLKNKKLQWVLKIGIALGASFLMFPIIFMIFLVIYTIAAPLWGENVFWGR